MVEIEVWLCSLRSRKSEEKSSARVARNVPDSFTVVAMMSSLPVDVVGTFAATGIGVQSDCHRVDYQLAG